MAAVIIDLYETTIWKIDRLAAATALASSIKFCTEVCRPFYISHEGRSLHLSVRYIRNVFASSKLSIGHLLKINLTLHIPD
jgi:hypothetical protein